MSKLSKTQEKLLYQSVYYTEQRRKGELVYRRDTGREFVVDGRTVREREAIDALVRDGYAEEVLENIDVLERQRLQEARETAVKAAKYHLDAGDLYEAREALTRALGLQNTLKHTVPVLTAKGRGYASSLVGREVKVSEQVEG